ncbi:hypothetical protein K7J14_08035 [Treponema zuelzerae]|uniref:Glucosamine inositolphosphorylceramide transferase 1 N-terminal domain-containing protein n=1 Tax=Teretinema zuelzerae TaxID=156 RepID=A0AAE3EJL4_9SPIR|nr:hypothetical protein [Teretinema zuelzerae]MCD1654653.1 hypothetical protein [Teretinema zuelzerae]
MSKLQRRIQKLFYREQWSLLIQNKLNNITYRIIPPSSNIIWADPFIVKHENRTYVFIEQQRRNQNGTLGYIEIFEDGSHSGFIEILKAGYHLSYPCVFQPGVNGDTNYFMIPETHENNQITLYRSTGFPDKWSHYKTLIKGISAVDATILKHGDLWWLFTSVNGTDTNFNNSLNIYFSNAFDSEEWTPHPLNPVSRKYSASRMAGSFLRQDDALIRPAQSCRKEYGEHLVFYEVNELTTTTYRETERSRLLPEKHLSAVCTHTFSENTDYIVRDIKTRKFFI